MLNVFVVVLAQMLPELLASQPLEGSVFVLGNEGTRQDAQLDKKLLALVRRLNMARGGRHIEVVDLSTTKAIQSLLSHFM